MILQEEENGTMASTDQILATLHVLERLHRLPDTVALTTSEAAIFLRSSVSALETMRASGAGPAYSQAGAKGVTGANQKCLYEKGDLLAWIRSNKVVSTMEAAVRKGQLFSTLFDVVQTEAFWIDSAGHVVGMVEQAPIGVVLSRLGRFDIVWMPVIDAAWMEWTELSVHRDFASAIESVLASQSQGIRAGVEATEIGNSLSEDSMPEKLSPKSRLSTI